MKSIYILTDRDEALVKTNILEPGTKVEVLCSESNSHTETGVISIMDSNYDNTRIGSKVLFHSDLRFHDVYTLPFDIEGAIKTYGSFNKIFIRDKNILNLDVMDFSCWATAKVYYFVYLMETNIGLCKRWPKDRKDPLNLICKWNLHSSDVNFDDDFNINLLSLCSDTDLRKEIVGKIRYMESILIRKTLLHSKRLAISAKKFLGGFKHEWPKAHTKHINRVSAYYRNRIMYINGFLGKHHGR